MYLGQLNVTANITVPQRIGVESGPLGRVNGICLLLDLDVKGGGGNINAFLRTKFHKEGQWRRIAWVQFATASEFRYLSIVRSIVNPTVPATLTANGPVTAALLGSIFDVEVTSTGADYADGTKITAEIEYS